jgi:UDP-N-acetylglucosamine 1-carboxyvinyltransferase
MDIYRIIGQRPVHGKVSISGSKNSSLPIMAATLLNDEKCVLENIPDLRDTRTMIKLLEYLGKKIKFENNTLTVESDGRTEITAPYEIVKTMRASICVLGPILAKHKKAIVSLPGGCAIGQRPVDLHIKAMELLGAKITLENGYIHAEAKELIGRTVNLLAPGGVTVLGTGNAMMAAVFAKGETIIDPAAMEPEVSDLGNFLNAMGAKVEGMGTSTIRIQGVEKLNSVHYKVIPDRIEAGTYLTMVGAAGGKLELTQVNPDHIANIIESAREAGLKIITGENSILVEKTEELEGIEISTKPYPGFPTDMQPQFMAMLSTARGLSIISENIFEDRFIHVGELQRMGANIRIEKGGAAIIKGIRQLSGAPVMASDLRAGAGLIVAGLSAAGTTEIQRIYHIERGYEQIEQKITAINGKIEKLK